ncbi:hypothetical protein D3C73_1376180 [compost metagenome]
MRKQHFMLQTGFGLLLLLELTGCSASYQAPAAVEIHQMTELDGKQSGLEDGMSPVMLDVYDRSIPAEVYSAQ